MVPVEMVSVSNVPAPRIGQNSLTLAAAYDDNADREVATLCEGQGNVDSLQYERGKS
jgi:hypothetical protein